MSAAAALTAPASQGLTIAIPVLETARLRLRAPEWRDFDAYAAFRASPRTAHVGGPEDRYTAFRNFCALAGHWAVRGYGRWIVADRATDDALGVVGPFFPEGWPEPEIAWTVFGHAEGRGIAFEAALAAREHAYGALGWTTAISMIAAGNDRSIALARRLGAHEQSVFAHFEDGPLTVWRHPGPETLRPDGAQWEALP